MCKRNNSKEKESLIPPSCFASDLRNIINDPTYSGNF